MTNAGGPFTALLGELRERNLSPDPKSEAMPRRCPLLRRRLFSPTIWSTLGEGAQIMASLDWSQCQAVESVPGRRSGAWVFRGTRMPVSSVFENLQDMNVDELVEEFGVTREQVQAVLQFAAHSTEAPSPQS